MSTRSRCAQVRSSERDRRGKVSSEVCEIGSRLSLYCARFSSCDKGTFCLSDCLSHQSVVGKRFTVDGAAEDESKQLPLAPSAVEAVDELGQVTRQMLPAHPVEGAAEPGLEVSEDPVDPGQDLHRAGGVGPLDASIVPDSDGGKTPVALESIRPDRGAMGGSMTPRTKGPRSSSKVKPSITASRARPAW